jgi:hypothetical protein
MIGFLLYNDFIMFVRTKTSPNSPRKSVQVVEACRVDGKVKQKIVRHIGIANDEVELARLVEIAHYEKALLEAAHQPQLFSPEQVAAQLTQLPTNKVAPASVKLLDLREQSRTIVGIHEVYGEIFDQLGLNHVFGARQASWRVIFKDLVLARIANPDSKRGSVRALEQDFGLCHSVDSVYRLMDKLDPPAIERLQQLALQSATDLLGKPVSVAFYDCTTLYFESFHEDELRQKGFSKDHKMQETQLLLAVLTTAEGLPLGYEIFPGATFEGHSLIPVITALQKRYTLEKVVFVADRGLFNEDNLHFLEEQGLTYVVGARIKNLPAALTAQVLNAKHYHDVELDYTGQDNDVFKVAEFKHKERRLVVSFSQIRARKDHDDRAKVVSKLRRKLDRADEVASFVGHTKKYLTQVGSATLALDEDKIKAAANFDGLAGVITNATETIATLLSHYHGLWHIEETFRLSKHDLKIRPIYHYKPERIKAHLAVCFAALLCVRHLTYRCALQYQKLSPEVIRRELNHVQISILQHQKSQQRYALPSSIGAHAARLYKLVGKTHRDTPYCFA